MCLPCVHIHTCNGLGLLVLARRLHDVHRVQPMHTFFPKPWQDRGLQRVHMPWVTIFFKVPFFRVAEKCAGFEALACEL